jgi:hypothetical protein
LPATIEPATFVVLQPGPVQTEMGSALTADAVSPKTTSATIDKATLRKIARAISIDFIFVLHILDIFRTQERNRRLVLPQNQR